LCSCGRPLVFAVGRVLDGRGKGGGRRALPPPEESTGAAEETASQIAARDHLLDEEARHDRLARAGIVVEKKAERLAREHRLVDRCNLVRQRVYERCVNCQDRIEKMGQPDAVRLGNQPKESAIAVEAPGPAGGGELEPALVFSIEELFAVNP